MLRKLWNSAIAWYTRSQSVLTTPLSTTECWHNSLGIPSAPPAQAMARHAILFLCTESMDVRYKSGQSTKLIVGQKIWCLDGLYFIAEDVSFRGEYRIRRGSRALDTYSFFQGVSTKRILPCFNMELANVPVEIIG